MPARISCTAVGVGEKAHQPLRIKQKKIRTLIGRKAPRESQSQRILVEDMIRIRWSPPSEAS